MIHTAHSTHIRVGINVIEHTSGAGPVRVRRVHFRSGHCSRVLSYLLPPKCPRRMSNSQSVVPTSSPEVDEQVIEKLFPKCRPKGSHQPAGTLPGKVQHSIHNNRVSPELVNDHRCNYDRSLCNNDRMNDCTYHHNNFCDLHYPSPSTSNNGDSGLNLHLLSFSPVKSTSNYKTKDHGSKHSNYKVTYNMNRAHNYTRMSDHASNEASSNKCRNSATAVASSTIESSYLISPTEELSGRASQVPRQTSSAYQERSSSEPSLESGVVSPAASQPLYTTMHSTESMGKCITSTAYPPSKDVNAVTVSARSLPTSPKAVKEEDTSALTNNCVSHSLNDELSQSGQSNLSTATSSPAKEIARIIGNIPIALYEGSPRRYGLKSQPGNSQRVLSSTSNRSHLLSRDNDDNYTSTSTRDNDEDDLEELQDLDTALVDVNCDELVKSILSIPLPSSTLNIVTSYTDERTLESPVSPESEVEKVDVSSSKQDEDNSDKQVVCESEAPADDCIDEGVDTNDSLKRSQSSDDPVISHESELILLHERVHQHLLQELSSPSVAISSQLNSGSIASKHSSSESQQQQQQQSQSQSQQQQQQSTSSFKAICQGESTSKDDTNALAVTSGKMEESRNFTLSPETTECDSNEIESEYSLSSGSKLTHMPILEDGLSSGMPSSDSEYEDIECNNSRSSMVGYVRKQLMFHNANNSSKGVCGENVPCHYTQSSSGKDDTRLTSKQVNDSTNYSPSHYTQSTCVNESNEPFNSHYNRERQSKHHSSESDVLYYEGRNDKSLNDSMGESEHRIKRRIEGSEEWSTQDASLGKMSRSKSLQMSNGNYSGSNGNGVNSSPCQARNHGKSQDNSWRNSASNGAIDAPGGMEKVDKPANEDDCDTDQETDRLLGAQRSADEKGVTYDEKQQQQQQSTPIATSRKKNTSREVLIEGVLFRARYLGSTQLICEGQPTKATRMMQAEEAVSRIKAPEGEAQPSTEVDLFISTEKIMVLNTDLKEIMMDHSLRTISYIADIGDLLVLMARRRLTSAAEEKEIKRVPKMICHVFESEEAQFIAQSIGQAFQVAYMEFLKANGIEDSSFVKEMDYQEVLNSQEIFGDELEMFARKDKQKEVIVPKHKGEILGMVIVESGWGSMLPTVVIANMAHSSPAARCGHLNIGDQIIAINGISLVGLPLSTCQNYVKNTKNQTAVKLTVVPCPPVVEVKIKRPDTKYQLGFSVQNGVICSLLRGGIAERGGVRVGHRIIEINGQSVVAVPHERIVNLLATSVGEISMKTMPTSMFRLLTGQESPAFI